MKSLLPKISAEIYVLGELYAKASGLFITLQRGSFFPFLSSFFARVHAPRCLLSSYLFSVSQEGSVYIHTHTLRAQSSVELFCNA